MMVELIVTCGATVSDMMDEYRAWTGKRLPFEEIWPGDPRGRYGEYLIWLTPGQAQMVVRRYSSVIRLVDDAASLDQG